MSDVANVEILDPDDREWIVQATNRLVAEWGWAYEAARERATEAVLEAIAKRSDRNVSAAIYEAFIERQKRIDKRKAHEASAALHRQRYYDNQRKDIYERSSVTYFTDRVKYLPGYARLLEFWMELLDNAADQAAWEMARMLLRIPRTDVARLLNRKTDHGTGKFMKGAALIAKQPAPIETYLEKTKVLSYFSVIIAFDGAVTNEKYVRLD